MDLKKVAVVMGSDSDLEVMKPAMQTLKKFDIPFDVRIISAHRTPMAAQAFSQGAIDAGYGVIIAAAGKAAHLAGVLASHTTLPVVGVPIQSGGLGGLDALLSTAQMPPGIPVAAMGVDGAQNAALYAIAILSVGCAELAGLLTSYRKEMCDKIMSKDDLISKEYQR